MGNWDSYDWLIFITTVAISLLALCMVAITIGFLSGRIC